MRFLPGLLVFFHWISRLWFWYPNYFFLFLKGTVIFLILEGWIVEHSSARRSFFFFKAITAPMWQHWYYFQQAITNINFFTIVWLGKNFVFCSFDEIYSVENCDFETKIKFNVHVTGFFLFFFFVVVATIFKLCAFA